MSRDNEIVNCPDQKSALTGNIQTVLDSKSDLLLNYTI